MTKTTNALSNVSIAPTNNLRDIKPPVEIPSGWIWLWSSLAAVVIAFLLILAWRHWQKRRRLMAIAPVIPAHIRAKQKLQEALALLGQPREFCILVSDTIRWYLEERFDFHAPERTTEEFLYELQNTELLTRDQKESLGEFLKRCDLVKFAKYEPREPELRGLHDSALRLVEETEPSQPSSGGPEQAQSMQFECHRPPHPGPLPKEREHHSRDLEGLDGAWRKFCQTFSLSLRERAGVRGKSASNCMDRALAGCPQRQKKLEPLQRFQSSHSTLEPPPSTLSL